MQKNAIVEGVVNSLWKIENKIRGIETSDKALCAFLYVLYGFHKQYAPDVYHGAQYLYQPLTKDGTCCDDDLLHELSNYFPQTRVFDNAVMDAYQMVSSIQYEEFEDAYIEILTSIIEKYFSSTTNGQFYSPDAITRLIAYFVKKDNCSSVYDPFCGTSSIIRYLLDLTRNVKFVGQDVNSFMTLLSKVFIDATGAEDSTIILDDSLSNWSNSHYDAVVSDLPWLTRIPRENVARLSYEVGFDCRTVEDLFFTGAFRINGAKTVVALLNPGINFRKGNDYKLRQFLIENNYIDTVISLPASLLPNTGVACTLWVCKKFRNVSDPVRFVNAEHCFIDTKKRIKLLDIDKLFGILEREDKSYVVSVLPDKIIENDYEFNPSVYIIPELKKNSGQAVMRLIDVISPVVGEKEVLDRNNIIRLSHLNIGFIDVLLNINKTETLDENEELTNYCYYPNKEGNKYLLVNLVGSIRYALYTKHTGFACSRGIQVYSINEKDVLPEYLVYYLLNNDSYSNKGVGFSAFLNLPIVLESPDCQYKLVEKQKQLYEEKHRAELEAEAERLGIKRNISDLEHMLGATQFKINNIISRLENIEPTAKRYPDTVKSLKDNVSYLNRLIHYSNAQISSETFDIQEGDLYDFLQKYADSWKNYGGNYFELQIENRTLVSAVASFDKTLLTVMLDSILSNAIRHGFHKNKNYTDKNIVQISLSNVIYQESSYLLISIANNGEPISSDFTIEDYISRGRYTSETGRSGLGGYHVYQIVKGHNGYLYLDSNDYWNVVVDVLLPNSCGTNSNMLIYEQECV